MEHGKARSGIAGAKASGRWERSFEGLMSSVLRVKARERRRAATRNATAPQAAALRAAAER